MNATETPECIHAAKGVEWGSNGSFRGGFGPGQHPPNRNDIGSSSSKTLPHCEEDGASVKSAALIGRLRLLRCPKPVGTDDCGGSTKTLPCRKEGKAVLEVVVPKSLRGLQRQPTAAKWRDDRNKDGISEKLAYCKKQRAGLKSVVLQGRPRLPRLEIFAQKGESGGNTEMVPHHKCNIEMVPHRE